MGQLRSATLKSPGSYGVNYADEIATEQSGAYHFMSTATNAIVDVDGKLAARETFVNQTTGYTGALNKVYVHLRLNGTEDVISAGSTGKVYTGTTTLTERYDGAGSANNWQFASLNGKLLLAQKDETIKYMVEGTWTATDVTKSTYPAKPNCVIAAYGRAWAADDSANGKRNVLWWSNLLDPTVWNSGDAGSLDLTSAWPNGSDSIMAIAGAFGRIIILGRNSILMYTLPDDNDPASMTLTDVTGGIGCVCRDSVYAAADGLYFLSDNGVYRIDRLAQVTSLMATVPQSALVNRDMLTDLASETLEAVRAGYYTKKGWYVLTLPTANKTYVFHTRQKIPQMELPPTTVWTNTGNAYRSFSNSKDGYWYCAATNGVHKYGGYTATGNDVYSFVSMTQWLDLGEVSRLKHLKYAVLTLQCASGQAGTFTWKTDYKEGSSYTATFACSAVEFAENPGIGDVKVTLGRSCNAVKLGFSVTVTAALKVHALTIGSQIGKTATRP